MSGRTLRILHFNDVYDITNAPRFVASLKERADAEHPALVLFSGDCYSPSLMSVVTHGAQMPPILDLCGVHASCFGNHEFDWGLTRCEELCAQCAFPWLMSNATWRATGDPLGGGVRSLLKDHCGIKVGLIGLIEREWLATLSTITEEEVAYEDFVPCARRLAASLRADGAEVVLALTHMRQPNDERLAAEVSELDLILGGHDHDFYHLPCGEGLPPRRVFVCKSGTDFRTFSELSLIVGHQETGATDAGTATAGAIKAGAVRLSSAARIDVAKEGPTDPTASALLEKYEAMVGHEMEAIVGDTEVALDARFATIRSRESNVSNFVVDVLREGTGAQLALLNAGTLRADRLLGPGALSMRDLVSLLPMADETIVVRVTGAQLLAALENGVSSYPKLEGRWPCVSGLHFAFDPSQPAGSRVVASSVRLQLDSGAPAVEGGEPLELDATYTLATKAYLAQGKDGYTMLREASVVVDAEQAPLLPGLVRNHFAERQFAAGVAEVGILSPGKRKQHKATSSPTQPRGQGAVEAAHTRASVASTAARTPARRPPLACATSTDKGRPAVCATMPVTAERKENCQDESNPSTQPNSASAAAAAGAGKCAPFASPPSKLSTAGVAAGGVGSVGLAIRPAVEGRITMISP